jgi:hypothetical protein
MGQETSRESYWGGLRVTLRRGVELELDNGAGKELGTDVDNGSILRGSKTERILLVGVRVSDQCERLTGQGR